MPSRCIMIFPDFEEVHRIEAIRVKYDPLFGVVRPHITLVFPFTSILSKESLCAHISNALSAFGPFPIVMRGISARREPDGLYIYLNAAEGGEVIRRISARLYEDALEPFKSARYGTAYAPHITLGRFQDEAALQTALAEIGGFPHEFPTTIRSVDMETIEDDGSSSIEMTFPLLDEKTRAG